MNTIPQGLSGAASRRTFAIISHPDAGKTTLTEKLLLFGGAIHLAGAVKARGERRRTRSDWMAIEKARGISVSSSVMTFERKGVTFNLLDTPGHEDFSEDTYRTLTAVDSAVMVIDAAKGIEPQTRKLFEVCRLRDVPITTFINKIDREGRDPFELLDEIEQALALVTVPRVWPVGMGSQFHGCFDLATNEFLKRSPDGLGFGERIQMTGPKDPALAAHVPADVLATFHEQAELASEAYPDFDRQSFLEGHQTAVIFGSALRDFSVEDLLDHLAAAAPSPRPQPAEPRAVLPDEAAVTGFVFKVQANMDLKHRDRVAFMRICSGRFQRGMKLTQAATGKQLAINNPIFFFAQERQLADEAFPGDIIGIPNHGTLRVGDTLTEGEALKFRGLPDFAPEILSRVRLEDAMRVKQLRRALEDLAEEGVAQIFRRIDGTEWVVGVVGPLQLDVLKSRIAAEYSLEVSFEPAPYEGTRWIATTKPSELDTFIARHRSSVAEDRDNAPVLLVRDSWELGRIQRDYPDLQFLTSKDRA